MSSGGGKSPVFQADMDEGSSIIFITIKGAIIDGGVVIMISVVEARKTDWFMYTYTYVICCC